MIRIAAVILLLSQFLLLRVVWSPTGPNAISFSFLGHPAVAIGIGVAMIGVFQRARANGGD